jgi:predicted RNase H-like HicB family nuclease
MRQYIALIYKVPDSDYGVSFPDLPGCVTAGLDLDDARSMAEDALALHLAGMADDEEPIPEPSSLEAVMTDRENRAAVAILVKAPPATAKAVRINMTLPEDELEQIDKFAAEQGYTRSGFLLHAAKRAMREATTRFTRRDDLPTRAMRQFDFVKRKAIEAARFGVDDALRTNADREVLAALSQLHEDILRADTLQALHAAKAKGEALQKAIDVGLPAKRWRRRSRRYPRPRWTLRNALNSEIG